MVPQTMEIEVEDDARTQNQKFLHKGPIVLLTIICSTIINGITLGVQGLWLESLHTVHIVAGYSLSVTAAPMIGIMFFSFISSVVGRKPVFITLFTLSILSAVLHSLPWEDSVRYSFPFHGLFGGGALIMNMLAITEYATPKHRLTYLLVDLSTLEIIHTLVKRLFITYSWLYPYVLSIQVVLGLLCVVSACRWPESPYWLASKGKLEESRKAFLWLRGQEGREELNSLLKERRSRGSIKLYWMSLFVALATISVSLFTFFGTYPMHMQLETISYSQEPIIHFGGSVAIASSISVLSYFVRRKILFIVVFGISVHLSYMIAIWINVGPRYAEDRHQLFYFVFLISNLISKCGLILLATVLCVEIIPVKYSNHIACVSLLTFYSVFTIFFNLFRDTFYQLILHYANLPVNTTLSMIGVVVYYFLAPETKGKTLLEIQKAYTPELSDANPKEEDEAMERL